MKKTIIITPLGAVNKRNVGADVLGGFYDPSFNRRHDESDPEIFFPHEDEMKLTFNWDSRTSHFVSVDRDPEIKLSPDDLKGMENETLIHITDLNGRELTTADYTPEE